MNAPLKIAHPKRNVLRIVHAQLRLLEEEERRNVLRIVLQQKRHTATIVIVVTGCLISLLGSCRGPFSPGRGPGCLVSARNFILS